MSEIILVSSSKDSGGGMCVLDVSTGSSVSPVFKNCIADKNCLTLIGNNSSSYGGRGSCGDYIIASQSQKPLLNSWQWNKSQVHDQYHIQEILTCLTHDTATGTYLIGGSKKGYIYIWDISTGELVRSLQAHYKTIHQIKCDEPLCNFVVSAADDGMIRVWEMDLLINFNQSNNTSIKKNESVIPYRSWTSHTLPVKDIALFGSGGVRRVASCSLDRTVLIHDIHTGSQVLRIALSVSLESICVNNMEDILFVGSTNGSIHVIDMNTHAIAISAAHTHITRSSDCYSTKSNISDNSGVSVLEGHTKAVTSISCSFDDMTLISGSLDGSLRIWNIWTKQCMKNVKPFIGGAPITNAVVVSRPDILSLLNVKPTLYPLQHLQKYKDENKASSSSKNLGRSIVGQNVNAHCTGSDVFHDFHSRDIDYAWKEHVVGDEMIRMDAKRKHSSSSHRVEDVIDLKNYVEVINPTEEFDDGNMLFVASQGKTISANSGITHNKSTSRGNLTPPHKSQRVDQHTERVLETKKFSLDKNKLLPFEETSHIEDEKPRHELSQSSQDGDDDDVLRLDTVDTVDEEEGEDGRNSTSFIGMVQSMKSVNKKSKKNKKLNPFGSPLPKKSRPN